MQGEADIERMLAAGELQQLAGTDVDGSAWLVKARRTLETATSVTDADPENAYVLAYDAARHACTALLAQQGLRPTTAGGHVVVERAARAQFGEPFRLYGMLRRRRNELEYPEHPDDTADVDEAKLAIATAEAVVDAADKLLAHLGLFS
jgi:HEPN domain-containing protein